MRTVYRQMTMVVPVAIFMALLAACSGGGGSGATGETIQVPFNGKTSQSEITTATMTDGLQSINTFVPICTTTPATTTKVITGSDEPLRERSTP